MAAVLIVGSGSALLAQTQSPAGVTRTDLQRHDLSAAGREVIQARIDFEPGSKFPRHKHPGEEIVYVLEGSLQYEVEGRSP